MKIVHISPSSAYNDYWGYQENLLPKYQRKLGHDVSIITTNTQFEDGKRIEIDCADYVLKDGIRVIRLKKKNYGHATLSNIHDRLPLQNTLRELKPDFIFFHGLVSDNIYDAVEYKNKVNSNCVIVQDNHLDYNIGLSAKSFKDKVVRQYYRRVTKKNIKYVARVYGVTPWRKQYAEDYFKVPQNKTDVLIMGADDEKIDFAHRNEIRAKIRSEFEIAEEDFLVVTGGKIDEKKNISMLMEAVGNLKNVKLLIFGQVSPTIKSEFEKLILKNKNICYIGWIEAEKVYDYFFAADLVFFPGQHSVLWEQACAAKVPCVFARWPGMQHVDNGGNSDFLDDVSVLTIKNKLEELLYTEKYNTMLNVAQSDSTDIYLYSHIAEKSLECANNI